MKTLYESILEPDYEGPEWVVKPTSGAALALKGFLGALTDKAKPWTSPDGKEKGLFFASSGTTQYNIRWSLSNYAVGGRHERALKAKPIDIYFCKDDSNNIYRADILIPISARMVDRYAFYFRKDGVVLIRQFKVRRPGMFYFKDVRPVKHLDDFNTCYWRFVGKDVVDVINNFFDIVKNK